MNIVYYLVQNFFKKEYTTIIFMIILSILITIFQTIIISHISALIIESVELNKKANIMKYFNYFIGISIVFLIVYYFYKTIQNSVLSKITQWIKKMLFDIVLFTNNEDMNHVNYIEFITPITRIAISIYALLFDCITHGIPTFVFLCVVSLFFFYYSHLLGFCFLVANFIIVLYLLFVWESLAHEKRKHESKVNENEKFIIDILNNIDKVILRGQNKVESNKLENMTDNCVNLGIDFLTHALNHVMVLKSMVYTTIFSSLLYLISLHSKKKITSTVFITFFTILLIYREKTTILIQNIPDYLEYIGKLEYIAERFNIMLGEKNNLIELMDKNYQNQDIHFDTIRFDNVHFKYSAYKKNLKKNEKIIFDDFSIQLNIQNKLIGICGLSGKGKSSFAKLILRLYEPTAGNIYIDNVNIKIIDPNYIRKNIVYINQNSKLFDKKIIENIQYGCENTYHCQKHMNEILKYEKIRNLLTNIDIQNDFAGPLGENLSGGQRQIINIISGLINPAKVLILDEPTNALDVDLKKEVISLIESYRNYKKCIIVITHDRDTYALFDKIINI
jgi:ABC-type bacteriocin/lantibiotic exporter with double-glycine peptidase domain